MAKHEARAIGEWRGVVFDVAQIDVTAASDDLLIVGMLEKDVPGRGNGGATELDHALHGTLSRLRAGGIFNGDFGETLMLTRPPAPIRAASLMLIGMGASPAIAPGPAGDLTELAMRTALRIGAGSVACLLGWSELDIPADQVAQSAAAMMHGALRAVDAHPNRARMRWTFDVRNGHADRTEEALCAALVDWR
ncbi:M17 family peptidase N-terminal domain-containing protein [Sphingomonas pokkalii]|uniref:Peptidase M17 n=1 Tax=Sphingomonas pokkalii TaxID=2175090 RepID=A0A2U0SG38_9SPHN|nr:M17 family peptidase N-terminal domain-containing protein [Sphingomonas pokkalii]PVX30336.1 peptidase M17 [Sphingomonas pokkalii]